MSTTDTRQRGPLDRALSAVLSDRNDALYDILRANPEAARATISDGEHKSRQLVHVAASFGNTGAVATLIHDVGVHIDTRDQVGRTPLDHAMDFGRDAAKDILQLGANPNLPSGPDGQRPLTLAVASLSRARDRNEMAQLLLAHGANPNLPNADGSTPLHVAAVRLDAELVRVLLASRYTDSTVVDGTGRTARDLISDQSHPDAKQISALLAAHEQRRPSSPSAATAFSDAVTKVAAGDSKPNASAAAQAPAAIAPPPHGPLLQQRIQQKQIGLVLGG